MIWQQKHIRQWLLLWLLYTLLLLSLSHWLQYNTHDTLDTMRYGILPVSVAGYTLWRLFAKDRLRVRLRFVCLTLIAGIWLAFCFFGKPLLFDRLGLTFSLNNWPDFLFSWLLCSVYVLMCYHLLSFRHHRTYVATRRTILALIIAQAIPLSLYWIAFNPGSFGNDTYQQLAQVYGLVPYSTWHPLTQTLIMQGLLTLVPHWSILTFAQVALYIGVVTAWLLALIQRGMPPKFAVLFVFILALMPTTGATVTAVMKDVPFTLTLLWLTLELLHITTERDYFSRPGCVLRFVCAMGLVALLRFNGLLVVAGVLLTMLVWHVLHPATRRERLTKSVSVLMIAAIIIGGHVVLPQQLNADLNPSGTKLRTIYNGLAAVYQQRQETRLEKPARDMVESVASPRQLQLYYNPYFADIYMRNVPHFIDNLSKLNTPDAINAYLHALKQAPTIILADKLNLSILSWSVTADPMSYNNAYTTNAVPPDPEAVHYDIRPYVNLRHHNALTDALNALAGYTAIKGFMTKAVLWRGGLYLALLAPLLMAICLHHRRLLLICLPFILNFIAVFLTMPAQDFRYVWFMPLLFPFLVLSHLFPSQNVPDAPLALPHSENTASDGH